MAKSNEYGIIKAPDGFYFGRILKSGMMAADNRKITDEEIIEMFLDVLRRNKAETGRSVMTIFSKRVPVLMAKLDPDIRETGILPQPKFNPEQMRQIQIMRQRQMEAMQRRSPLRVGASKESQN